MLAPTLVVVAGLADLLRAQDPDADRVLPEDALARLLSAPAGTSGVDEVAGAARWGARTRGGLRLGPRSLAALTCSSRITRLLLDERGHPLDSSPLARQLTRRERRALEHRAGYRCEREGCGRAALLCVPHHVVPWALGGPSTLANTVLLCHSCHHLLHDRQRGLELTGERRIGTQGWLRGGPG